MKKRIFSILTCLALVLSFLPMSALAEDGHTCIDEDNSHWCDICSTLMEGVCIDNNEDHWCDEGCGNRLSTCEEEDWNSDRICDLCGDGIYPSASELNAEAEEGNQEITLYWSELDAVGDDVVVAYTVYCYEENDDPANADTERYEAEHGVFSHSFWSLTNGTTYCVGVQAEYESGYQADQEILATPVSPNAAFIAVGDTVVLSDHQVMTDSGEGWSYDAGSNTLTLSDAEITTGYAYDDDCIVGIYASGDLDIELAGDSSITAPDGTYQSSGIYVAGDLCISGNGTLTAIGGDVSNEDYHAVTSGITTDGRFTINAVSVIAIGGSASVTGEGQALSSGVYTTDFDVDFSGSLIAAGGTANGLYAYSSGMEAYGSEETYINVTVYDGYLEATGGTATGSASAGSVGLYLSRGGLYVCESGADVTITGGEASATSDSPEDGPYAYSNGVYVDAGDVGIEAGSVTISSDTWTALDGDGYAIFAQAHEEEEDGFSFSSGGNVQFDCSEVFLAPNSRLIGPTVSITAEKGSAVRARSGLDLDDALIITEPTGGQAVGIWETEPDPDTYTSPDYYSIVSEDGSEASSVTIGLKTYRVTISGLSYVMSAAVPAGWSLNETYCDLLEIEDFSERLDTKKPGYRFVGWYTDESLTAGSRFSFDDNVEEDITIYPKWVKRSSGSNSSSSTKPTKPEETPKVFEDVHEADYWAEKAIDFVVARGLYAGTSDTTFHPDMPMTRGMLVLVLHNLAGSPDHTFAGSFEDVPNGTWYEKAVYWAAGKGIVSGYGNGLFGAEDNISREQLAFMLWRYAGSPESDHSLDHFADQEQISSYAQQALAWANANGILGGKGNSVLDPKGDATRAEVAQMLMNFVQQ